MNPIIDFTDPGSDTGVYPDTDLQWWFSVVVVVNAGDIEVWASVGAEVNRDACL